MNMKFEWNAKDVEITMSEEFFKAAKQDAQNAAMRERGVDFEDFKDNTALLGEVIKDGEARTLAAALANPKKSEIATQDPALAKVIEEMKDLVDSADEINKRFGSDITIGAAEADKYTVHFRGQLYAYELSVKGVEKALERLKGILTHHPHVIVEEFRQDTKATKQKACLDLQTFIACKMNRFLGIVTLESCDGPFAAVAYTPKSRNGAAYRGDDIDEDVDESEEW